MSLSSQSELGSGSGLGGGANKPPPVPRFEESSNPHVPVSSQQLPLPPPQLEIPLSQADPLGTQDFITPVDQFNLDYDPRDAKRSPARLTPNRVKRPRQAGGSAGVRGGVVLWGASCGAVAGKFSSRCAAAGPAGWDRQRLALHYLSERPLLVMLRSICLQMQAWRRQGM